MKLSSIIINSNMRIVKWFQFFAAIFLLFSRNKIKGERLDISNAEIWLKNLRKRAVNSVGANCYVMFKEFLKSDIYIERELGFKNNKNLIAICVIKNDIERLKAFLEHYRKLGVNQFAFLDDKSTDGTKEFLLLQNDVELFASSQNFFTNRKEAWLNRILAYYDFNRWYLVVDSDELLVYDDFENRSLIQFINLLEKDNVTAVSGMMVDMYSKEVNSSKKTNIYDGVDYFDKSGYFQKGYSRFIPNPTGGMRYRCFGLQITLGKTPLFFMDDKTVYHMHWLFPFEKNFQKDKSIALLHYKFLSGDVEKYKERVNRKCMNNDSEEYKQYMEKMDGEALIFFDEKVSEKFTSSQSLVENGLIEEVK